MDVGDDGGRDKRGGRVDTQRRRRPERRGIAAGRAAGTAGPLAGRGNVYATDFGGVARHVATRDSFDDRRSFQISCVYSSKSFTWDQKVTPISAQVREF